MTTSKKNQNTKFWRKCVEIGTLIHFLYGYLGKQFGCFKKMLEVLLSFDLVISLQGNKNTYP